MDVVFYESFEEERETLKRHLPSTIHAEFFEKTIQEEGTTVPSVPVLCIRTQSIIPLEWNTSLDAIISRSTGYDHLLEYRKAATKKIHYGYLPLYCSRAVAEQALMLWLGLMRRMFQQVEHFFNFDRNGLTGQEMQGKKLLVVGVGNIGSEVARLGQALGMEVKGTDLVQKHDFIDYISPDDGLAWADVIVCAMNLTEKNHAYFSRTTLNSVKTGAIFINIARGELAPAQDLLFLLQEGVLAGVGLDVYQNEKDLAVSLRRGSQSSDPEQNAILDLARHPNAILTPHNAFNTSESLERKAEQTAMQLHNYLEKGTFLWNVP